MKKLFFIFGLIQLFPLFPLFSESSQNLLYMLCLSAMENNADVQVAELAWKNAELTRKGSGGNFAPSVSFASSATVPNDYEWETCPDGFTSSVNYSQPLPGGTVLGFSGTYSYSATDFGEERLVSQAPQVSFTLSQSLLPFWAQGKLRDPTILSVKKQSEYYYNQLLYTKKNVIQKIVQDYVSAFMDGCKITIYENYIELADIQMDALFQMQHAGETSNFQILELQNKKWSYQQDLMSLMQSRQAYIQSLKNLCGCDFNGDDFMVPDEADEKFFDFVSDLYGGVSDPCEKALLAKIEAARAFVAEQRQAAAPVMKISAQPAWSLDPKKANEWCDAWSWENKPENWTFGIAFDFSPLFASSGGKNTKKALLDYEQTRRNYDAYVVQRNFVHNQYKTMLDFCVGQKENAEKLYNDTLNHFEGLSVQVENGSVSQYDYDNIRIQMKNSRLSLECTQALVWLYMFNLFSEGYAQNAILEYDSAILREASHTENEESDSAQEAEN